MKQLLRSFFTLLVVAGVAGAQPQDPRSPALSAAEPFRIDRGSSFDASAPRGFADREAGGERNRILENIREAESLIEANYAGAQSLDRQAMERSALESMLHSLDPHSNFFPRDEWRSLLEEQKSGYAGVGMSFAEFTRGQAKGMFVISTVPGTSAERLGLKFGDRIVAVNGMAVDGKSSEEIRSIIRGAVGTTVSMEVEPAGFTGYRTVQLTRSIIPQPSVPDAYLIRPGVGFLELTGGFNYTTADEVKTALGRLRRDGMTSLIIDLRGNGGGIVDQAVKVAEKFLPFGQLIVSQRGRTDLREWRSGNSAPENIPLVLLVDENTASASEIVAGAFQDSDRAIIVGERTFGKGLVQNVIDLPENTGLTLTAARYFTPTGRSIQRDYSEMGRYEYFSHKDATSPIDEPYIETRTITNRKMLSGHGIAPDVESKDAILSHTEVRLLDPLMFFARDLADGHIAAFPKHDGSRIMPVLSDRMVDEFIKYAESSDFGIASSESGRFRSFISLRLRYLLMSAEKGSLLAERELVAADPMVECAIHQLPLAGQLNQRAARLREAAFR